MDDLLAEFIAESREMLDALGEAIVAWEAAPGDRTRLDEIFRFVHTVKGNSGFFDMPRLGALSHAAEDALAEVRSGKRAASGPLVTAVLAIIDRIGALVHALESGDPAPAEDDERLIAALKAQAVPEAAAPVAAPEPRKAVRSIRLSVDLLDQMMSGVSDMVLARNELARRLRETPADPAVGEAFERVSACIAEMRDAIMRTRMQRIDALFLSLPRLVRDLAAELGKTVELEVDGGDVELDREMIETIRDPLTHIIRNAVDHGIESAADRAKAGKPVKGCLQVCARQSGNQILIEISDDGRGIDGDALVRKAVAAGVIGAEEGARLSPAERASLVFEAGLSTAQAVTSISGRGVGMDVVRANIERIGGVVEIDSRPGQGLRLTLRVPLTLTIIPALTVSTGGQVYAIPRSAIEEIVRCRSNAVRIDQVGGAAMASIRERRLPLVSLAASLGLQPAVAPMDQSLIVLKPAGGELYALAVDAVHDHEELVIKPAAALLMGIGLYAGTTLADDGSPVLLLDPSGLAADAGVLQDSREAPVVLQPEAQRETVPALLFRGLDGVKRAVRLGVVERIEDVPAGAVQLSAGRIRVAIGDRILPLAGCDGKAPTAKLRLLRMSDGASELAYGFAEVIDIVQLGPDLMPAGAPGEIGGVALIGSDQVEVLDPHWLFAAEGAGQIGLTRPPVCLIPGDDPWMSNILRPMIEAAGYQVRQTGPEADADVVISSAEAVSPGQGSTLRIRTTPEPANEADDSVYRYDRAGLLTALNRRARS
jgi:two-component system chemotaxis sensor kinase CheA